MAEWTSELIQFNEDTIWCGQPHDYSNTNSTLNRLRTIQTNCFNRVDILSDATELFDGHSGPATGV